MTTRRRFVAAAFAFAAGACSQQPAATFTAADEAAVREVGSAVVRAVSANDAAAYAAQFEPNGEVRPPNGKAVTGTDALVAWFKGFPPVEHFAFNDVAISGDVNTAMYRSAVVLKMKGVPVDTAKQLAVIRRQPDGKWLVVSVSFNSDLPLPAPPAPPVRR
ncbi:MAG TPA: DUF4440 domain-containing protein [Gemmatimonadaceae bacterium]|nr:DUF4440 domain-containing protein [Gemmatimonadaceae bacterium]